MWTNRSICSYSDFNLAYVTKFQYKTVCKKKIIIKNGRHGNPQPHIFLLTVYILYKKTKFPSNIVFTSQSHKVAYFDDVGSTCAIDQKINHLHNDRVANMWRNNVSSVCGRG